MTQGQFMQLLDRIDTIEQRMNVRLRRLEWLMGMGVGMAVLLEALVVTGLLRITQGA